MRIAVHAKVLSERSFTGIGVYTYNVLKALASIDGKNRYTLYSNEPLVHEIKEPNFDFKKLDFPALWSYLRLPLEFIGGKYDVLFVPKEMIPPFKRPKTVVTCFDLMGLMFADKIAFDGKAHFWMAVHYALKRADKIIAISESTKNDIVKNCNISPDNVVVTHLGYNQNVFKPPGIEEIDDVKRKYGLKGRYFINSSSLLWYRKNLLNLIKGFSASKLRRDAGASLVITGKRGEAYDEIVSLIRAHGLEKNVVLTDYIPLEDMPVLLGGAEALIFPSLHEGFGLPLVEAMACGCPVVTSNSSAMPEVVGEAGLLVDPKSVSDISSAIDKVLHDKQFSETMREKGLKRASMFTWEHTARKTLKVFETV